jgi:hypothetical protein
MNSAPDLEKITIASVGRWAYFSMTAPRLSFTWVCSASPMSICFPLIW